MKYDLIIVGGGLVGTSLACLLGDSGLNIAIIERQALAIWPDEPNPPFELRVSAISRASQQILTQAGAWEKVSAMRISPYEAMQVWDATGSGQIRFEAAALGEPNLGHIIENRALQVALQQTSQTYSTIEWICPAQVIALELEEQRVSLRLADGRELQASLVVSAEGGQSIVREQAGIAVTSEDYAQKGVVCTAYTALTHEYTAWQRFLPTGPVAFLPLPDVHACSIVWTLPADQADRALHWDEDRFRHELGQALDFRLGEVLTISERAAFPLRGLQAERYVVPRIALIGDAAHSIHPLAGQGVNLGFKDAAVLAENLRACKPSEIGSLKILRAYERARRGDNVLTQAAMEGFNQLFGNTLLPWQVVRNRGLSLVDQLTWLKHPLARHALGI